MEFIELTVAEKEDTKRIYEARKKKDSSYSSSLKQLLIGRMLLKSFKQHEEKKAQQEKQRADRLSLSKAKRAAAALSYKKERGLRCVSWGKYDVRITKVYQKAAEWGMVVDHVIPLRGELVSGLHVWENLQLLHPKENNIKSNHFELA